LGLSKAAHDDGAQAKAMMIKVLERRYMVHNSIVYGVWILDRGSPHCNDHLKCELQDK
jgi:hypothetical protein